LKNIKNKILDTSSKLTNISLLSLSTYSLLYYTDKNNILTQNETINTFLNTMQDKLSNSPEEIAAAAFTIIGSYTMGNKNPHIRLGTFALWSLSNVLYGYIAVKNNMTPLLGQMAIFQMINMNAIKNILKDEIVPEYIETLKEDKIDESIMGKMKKWKNNAVVNGARRVQNLFDDIKIFINENINTIKEHKNKSLLLLTGILSSSSYFLNEKFNLTQNIPNIVNTLEKSILSSPLESTAALTALIGSYLLAKTDLDNKIKGVGLFLGADIMYMNISYTHDMAPMLVQTLILVGGSLKALDNLYQTKDLSKNSINIEENKIYDTIKENISKISNFNDEVTNDKKIQTIKNVIER